MTPELKQRIIEMANAYISIKKSSFKMVGEKFGVCEATAWKYLNQNLKHIDLKLYKKVQDKKQKNINRSQANIIKFNIKKSFKCACSELKNVFTHKK